MDINLYFKKLKRSKKYRANLAMEEEVQRDTLRKLKYAFLGLPKKDDEMIYPLRF